MSWLIRQLVTCDQCTLDGLILNYSLKMESIVVGQDITRRSTEWAMTLQQYLHFKVLRVKSLEI